MTLEEYFRKWIDYDGQWNHTVAVWRDESGHLHLCIKPEDGDSHEWFVVMGNTIFQDSNEHDRTG